MDECVRLDSQGYGAAEIAPRLNRLSHEVAQLMETPEYKAQRLANQDRLRFLFENRLLQLWGLSNEVILAAQETVASYREKLQEPEMLEKEIRALRKDALDIMKDVLDRIGLKAPDKSELKITENKTVEDVTSLETYERRLALVKQYQEAGQAVPVGLCEVELDG